jgi:FkbM family methyltransferase
VNVRTSFHAIIDDLRLRTPTEGVSDHDIAREVLLQDQYRLAGLEGVRLGAVIDIGAHVGCFSRAVLHLHPENTVLSIEPEAANFRQLEINLAHERTRGRARCLRAAVSSDRDRRRLCRSATNSGAHRTARGSGLATGEEVTSITLADALTAAAAERIGLLKIDCEGGEYDIVAGADSATLQRVDLVVMELHATPELLREGHDPNEVLARLAAEGFELRLLEDIFYLSEGRFWVVAAINRTSPGVDFLRTYYRAAKARRGGDLLHRWFGPRLPPKADERCLVDGWRRSVRWVTLWDRPR